jgi:hypothetical protein
MKKIIRLTENDLARIVRRVIKEQPSMTEPTRRQFGTIDKLKSTLTGKVVKMLGSSTKHNPILKIENVEARSLASAIAKDVVYLDCSIVNEYGEERGGAFDSGLGGNVDVTYNCTNNPTKIFTIDSEIMGQRNYEIGGETYVNPNLSNAIETNYCSSARTTPTIKTDY